MCDQCDVSELVHNRIEAFLEEWPQAEFGPAHLVLSDYNLSSADINWCLHPTQWIRYSEGHDEDELAATRVFLEALLAIPEKER